MGAPNQSASNPPPLPPSLSPPPPPPPPLALIGSASANSSKELRSQITYEVVAGPRGNSKVPTVLGAGSFARVVLAWQRSAGHNVRPVALKILRENATKKSEQLSLQEISILKRLAAESANKAINILDILQLGPMILCGNCGQIYHPRCPSCGEHLLERYDKPGEHFPFLRCKNHTHCSYMISGEHVANGLSALMQFPAKTCCAKDRSDRAKTGTLLNFVDRDAVVMELMQQTLAQFLQGRRKLFARLAGRYELVLPGGTGASRLQGKEGSDPPAEPPASSPEALLLCKVRLLEKSLLMVQLADSLYWLHRDMKIVHKDIAPDNTMVAALPTGTESGKEHAEPGGANVNDALTSLASFPSFSAKIIDFGLADHQTLSRNWYEEEVHNLGAEKQPYLSPEAEQRKQRIDRELKFDTATRTFIIPDLFCPGHAGELAIKVGDLLVDESDPSRYYAVTITAVERVPSGEEVYRATYEGELPLNPESRQYHIIKQLGEAHDVYGMGAVFFYILTGDHNEVRDLKTIASTIQRSPVQLSRERLRACSGLYERLRSRLPEPFYQDRLMALCLKAMVRGLPESFSQSRTERGHEAARRLQEETRAIYKDLLAEVLSDPVLRNLEQLTERCTQLLESSQEQSAKLSQQAASYSQQATLLSQTSAELEMQRSAVQQMADNILALQTAQSQVEQQASRRQLIVAAGGLLALLLGLGGGYALRGSGTSAPAASVNLSASPSTVLANKSAP